MAYVTLRKVSPYDDEPYDDEPYNNERNERRYKKSTRANNKTNSYLKETYEKCIIRADEAIMMGDRAIAEIYYQHAEHYLHLMNRAK